MPSHGDSLCSPQTEVNLVALAPVPVPHVELITAYELLNMEAVSISFLTTAAGPAPPVMLPLEYSAYSDVLSKS